MSSEEQEENMDELEDELLLSILIRRRKRRRKSLKRSTWVRDMFRKRELAGFYHTIFVELKTDREYFYRHLRMSPERFGHLLGLIKNQIKKTVPRFRKPISAEERLLITLRFLASGESQQSLSLDFLMGRSTVSKIVSETCEAIYFSLKDPYLKSPQNANDWRKISRRFEEVWNFPHVISAIDGKHIRIECPKQSGTLYHNYKGYFSIVLLAICDADYCFTLFDVGSYGSNNDSGILANSLMGQMFDDDDMMVPEPENLAGCKFQPLPYYLLRDDIFPLKPWLIRPYPGRQLSEEKRIYNYHQSRASKVAHSSKANQS